MKFTHDLPTKEGYYWWTNFGEHTPTVVKVERDYSSKKLWADNGEYTFEVKKINLKKLAKENKKYDLESIDGHHVGEHMWCPIEVPTMDGKFIELDCY